MSKVERERKKTCKKCFEEVRCISRWGQSCNRNGGKKVPRFKQYNRRNYEPYMVSPNIESIRVVSSW